MINNVKEYYRDMIKDVSGKISEYGGCFRFAVVTDTHLDNSLDDTLTNISAVDSNVNFNCIIHLGDFLNGNLPKHYTQDILDNQMKRFCGCTAGGCFYPVQGNHDGFADLTGAARNIAIDEDWYKATGFVDEYKHAARERNKPYFYIDYPEEKIRFIILCTFYYTGSYDGGDYNKIYGTDNEQVQWFEETALRLEGDWTVIVCSHDAPFERFDEKVCIDNPRINGNNLMEAVKRAMKRYGFTLAAWLVGHFHGDYIGRVNGLNFILVASETAYVPQLWDMPEGGSYPERELNTASEDLWDSVVIDKKARKIRLFRFGAGQDREIDY